MGLADHHFVVRGHTVFTQPDRHKKLTFLTGQKYICLVLIALQDTLFIDHPDLYLEVFWDAFFKYQVRFYF